MGVTKHPYAPFKFKVRHYPAIAILALPSMTGQMIVPNGVPH
jgi:hypothetical protein